jgi:hypothetical protein
MTESKDKRGKVVVLEFRTTEGKTEYVDGACVPIRCVSILRDVSAEDAAKFARERIRPFCDENSERKR